MNKKYFVFLSLVTVLSISFFFFQNCSKTSFGAADSSTAVGEQLTPATPAADYSRTKVLLPEVTEQQNNQKVKALIVVDNSATMTNSQNNLSNNIASLMNELAKYDAEIQIVSTTYSTEDCTQPATATVCRANANYTYGFNLHYDDFYDANGIKRYGSIMSEWLNANPVTTYKINSTLSTSEKNQVISEIAAKIKSLGVSGSDNERQFATAALTAERFFKKDDRALIFVLTDEDDESGFYPFTKYTYRLSQSANLPAGEPIDGVAYFRSKIGATAFGSCTTYNEIHQSTGTSRVDQGIYTFDSMALCQAYVSSVPDCSLSCTQWSLGYDGKEALNGLSVEQKCNEIRAGTPATYTLTSCAFQKLDVQGGTVGTDTKGYLFGNTDAQIQAISNIPAALENLIISQFKSKVISLFNEKYLISVATNIGALNCPLGVGQSQDKFFSKIKHHFPDKNFSISSICDTAGSSSSGIAKVAADFVNIVSTKYAIGLTTVEKLVSAKIKVPSSSDLVPLTLGQDYKIENDQFVLLNQNFNNFERIEILIDRK